MTANEVKDAHDRIWAVREKVKLTQILIGQLYGSNSFYIGIQYADLRIKHLTTISEVNQFLKELG